MAVWTNFGSKEDEHNELLGTWNLFFAPIIISKADYSELGYMKLRM